MLNRIEKRIVIGATYIIFFLAVGALAFVFWPKQVYVGTCFDKIQNQNETGVDCGGACSACLTPEETLLQKIDVKWAKIFRQKQGIYDLASSIENLNYTYGGQEIDYAFHILDNSGKEISAITGTTYILPHGARYVVRQAIAIPQDPASVSFEITNVDWKKIDGYTDPGFSVEQKKLEMPLGDSNIFAKISGVVSNNSPYGLRFIDVDMVVFDALNNPIAVNHSDMQTLPSGQKRAFTVFWSAPFSAQAQRYDIYVNSNLFLADNLIKG
ncbi:MAG: hypothetical protein HYV65_03255 [Candidatus Spechtbacteria bacterium]|nr:hypothetical protein [Candidatus Spechtbacteria bacterium]